MNAKISDSDCCMILFYFNWVSVPHSDLNVGTGVHLSLFGLPWSQSHVTEQKEHLLSSRAPLDIQIRSTQPWAIDLMVWEGVSVPGYFDPIIVSSTILPIGWLIESLLSGDTNFIPVCLSQSPSIKTVLVYVQIGADAPFPWLVP